MTQGCVIIKTGVILEGNTEIITATDDGFADPISDFDMIGVVCSEPPVLQRELEVTFRRSGQGLFDTSYVALKIDDAAETFDAASPYLPTTEYRAQTVAMLHNVGLAAPVIMFAGDINSSLARLTYGIHNSDEICDAIQLDPNSASLGTDVPYQVWGIYKGKSAVIDVIDMSVTDLSTPYEILSLDGYENIRIVMTDKSPVTGVIGVEVRSKASGLYLTNYETSFFNATVDGSSTDTGMPTSSGNQFSLMTMRGFGLSVPSQITGAYLGTVNRMMISGNVTDLNINDGLRFTATGGTPTTGKIYVTGMLI